MDAEAKKPPTVFTIGHSTRPQDDFIKILAAHSISLVADVRTIPRSRHNPQFNIDTLPSALEKAGIGYIHVTGLGGLRRAQKESPSQGWKNSSFRGFADYMQTEQFKTSLDELRELAANQRVALMCAEALPWRCHRSLIADALLIRGFQVEHIMDHKTRRHEITLFAEVSGKTIIYPPQGENGDSG